MTLAGKARERAAARPISKQRLRLWLRLLRAARAIESELRERLRKEFAITLPQFDVMAALARKEDGMTMTELSRMREQPAEEPGLAELLPHIDASLVDLILVEGFKRAPIPKIEVYRPNVNKPLLSSEDGHVIAVASDAAVDTTLPVLNLNDPEEIAVFILQWLKSRH